MVTDQAQSVDANAATYQLLRDEADYRELGGDFFVRRTDTGLLQQRLVRQLEQLGNRVTLEPLEA